MPAPASPAQATELREDGSADSSSRSHSRHCTDRQSQDDQATGAGGD